MEDRARTVSLAAMLMTAGMRVTGPRPAAAAIAMDKLATAAIARSIGIPTIETVLWSPGRDIEENLPTRPWVVKPRWGGSSIDVEAGVEDSATVDALARRGVGRAGVLVQPYLNDWVDLNISVRTHPDIQFSAIERPISADGGVLGYQQKYLTGGSGMEAAPRELPARIPTRIRAKMEESALALARVMDLTGAPRMDYLWDGENTVLLCEVNPIPGAWGNYLWKESGVPPTELYRDLLAEAATSPGRLHQWLPSSDGRALRMSSPIAVKLL